MTTLLSLGPTPAEFNTLRLHLSWGSCVPCLLLHHDSLLTLPSLSSHFFWSPCLGYGCSPGSVHKPLLYLHSFHTHHHGLACCQLLITSNILGILASFLLCMAITATQSFLTCSLFPSILNLLPLIWHSLFFIILSSIGFVIWLCLMGYLAFNFRVTPECCLSDQSCCMAAPSQFCLLPVWRERATAGSRADIIL